MTKYTDTEATMRHTRLALRRFAVSLGCRVCLVAIFIGLSLLYVTKTSAVSTRGYAIHDLEKKVATLEHETRALDVRIAEHRSMASIHERVQGMGFVAAESVVYMNATHATVALR